MTRLANIECGTVLELIVALDISFIALLICLCPFSITLASFELLARIFVLRLVPLPHR